jgi:hypothetical protein
MTTMVFREELETGKRLRRRIMRNLELRSCTRANELLLRLGEPEDLVRAELEILMLRGEIERIRPVGYSKSDLDSYAIPRPGGHPWDD